jgi:HSP20 family protein
MTLKDLMPWGHRGRQASTAALENVRGIVETVERAFEEPWELTSARLLGSEWTPKLDVKETEKDVVVTAHLPGLEKRALHVSATDDSLSLRGVKRTTENDVEKVHSFYRSISLPATVRADDIRATFRDSRLTVTLPKAKHSRVRRITIG